MKFVMSPSKKNVVVMLFLLGQLACGSSSENTSVDSPDVAGSYSCTSGCDPDMCLFDHDLTVVQNSGDVTLQSDSYPDMIGTIDSNGEFSVSSDACQCDGQIVSGVANAACICEGVVCQDVSYSIQ